METEKDQHEAGFCVGVKYANGGYILKDWLGRLYSVGTEVVYPRYTGNSIEIVHGFVTDICRIRRNDDFKWVRIEPEDEYVDYEYRVSINTVDSSSSWPQASAKEVTIKNIKNITVIGVPAAAARPFAGCVSSE